MYPNLPEAARMKDVATITCPKCGAEFPLTAALTEQLSGDIRQQYQQELRAKENAFAEKEKQLKEKSEAVARRAAGLEEQVQARLQEEKARIAASEKARAEEEVAKELKDLARQVLDQKAKRQQAEQAELAVRAQLRSLDEEKASWEVEKQRLLDKERANIREAERKRLDEERRLTDAEREKTIQDLKEQLDAAIRRAERGSQQLQGEVAEVDLEEALRHAFPEDEIEEVKKGARGGDCIQRIRARMGGACAAVLWECKRAQAWSGQWTDKAKSDAGAAKADIAIIVSDALPQGIEHIDWHDGVIVTRRACVLPIARLVRERLIETARARAAAQGRDSRAQCVYDYLIGPEFAARIRGIAEPFVQMQDDLDSERRVTNQRWAKRQKQIERVLESAFGLRGDLEGLSGTALQELEEFGARAIVGDAVA